MSANGAQTGKTPVTQLNELRQGQVTYKLVGQSGPSHQPLFVMSCRIEGEGEYTGEGPTKQVAKQAAALQAVCAVMSATAGAAASSAARSAPTPASIAGRKRPLPPALTPFGDQAAAAKVPRLQQPLPPHQPRYPPPPHQSSQTPPPAAPQSLAAAAQTPTTARPLPGSAELATKNPVSLLNELLPNGVAFSLAETKELPGQTPRFVIQCLVNGVAYKAEAGNKKVAKMRAAQIALREAFQLMSTYTGSGDAATPQQQQQPTATPAEQAFADAVQSLVRAKFDQLVAGLPERLARRKVLAGVVMSRGGGGQLDPGAARLTVLCVTTGTKCLSGQRLNADGDCLLDCHAEILSRRCLVRIFQAQLATAGCGRAAESIFYRPTPGGLFRLKPDIALHLYISTSPCGDARVFAPTETAAVSENGGDEDEHPTRASRGLLRTKIECGEGTIPVPAGLVAQTWDGILGGERLLTMSCSDKLAAWCLLGLQGCLLSRLLEPVHLRSVVIGSAFNHSHCRRALIGRLERPPPGLPVTPPALLGVTERDPRQARSAPDCALNWCILDAGPELVNSSTGRLEPGSAAAAGDAGCVSSRLAKRSLFAGYASLLGRLPRQRGPQPPAAGTTYREAKLACRDYRSAKAAMVAFLRTNGRGFWAAKPFELQEFTLG